MKKYKKRILIIKSKEFFCALVFVTAVALIILPFFAILSYSSDYYKDNNVYKNKEISAVVRFKVDSHTIHSFYKEMIDAVISKYQKTNGADKITLEGSFVPWTRTKTRVVQMDAVFNYLVDKGIPKWKIDTKLKTEGFFKDGKPYNLIKISFPDPN